MPTDIMDQRLGPSLCLKSAPASFFSQERQVGFWKLENVAEHSGREGVSLMSGSKSFSSPPVEKIRTPAERSATLSLNSWRVDGLGYGFRPDLFTQPASVFTDENNGGLNDLLSNSLSNMFEELKLSANDDPFGQSIDTVNSNLKQDEPFPSLEEIQSQSQAIRNLPSNDDDLLAGVSDGLACGVQLNHGDDMDDIFSSGGGMELEEDANFSHINFYNSTGETGSSGHHGTLNNQFASQHPYGAHPSRTLFVRNITSDVEDTELKALFEQYGDIQTLYTACKHRGFVIISYYDIRAATNAISALQTKPLRHQKLDIQFSISKDNSLEKGINEGTLVVFDLDSSISNDDIHHIFGVYGGIKEVHGTRHEHNHMFIEFYDVRAAEAALRALNMTEIAGKRIKLERARHLMQNLPRELELEEFSGSWHGSPSNNSTTGFYGADRLVMETAFQGTSSGVPHSLSSPLFVGPLDVHSVLSCHSELSHSLGQMNFGCQCMTDSPSHSTPGYHDGMQHGFGSPSNHSVEHNESAFGFTGNGSFPLNVPQHMWNNSGTFHHSLAGSVMWPNSPASANNIPLQLHGFPGELSCMLPSPHRHVSSAPAINPSLWDRRRGHPRNADAHAFHPSSLGRAALTSRNTFPRAWGNHVDFAHNGTPPRHRARMSQGTNYVGPASDAPNDRITNRISDSSANQAGDKKQFELVIERIFRGEDSRTTIMIKNIPNKYCAKLLLATIDEHNKGTYDFFYLPIDFKNKCNVGYAFINMINPRQIIPMYQAFNGKKWEKFNSEKVALLTYARIQGKENLIAHFQNSSLMNEDKGYRPLLFHTCGPNAGDQEPFPMGSCMRSRPCKQRSGGYRESHWGSLLSSQSEEGSSSGAGSSSAYFKSMQ